VHQKVHEISINVVDHYVLICCDDNINIYDDLPCYCVRCGQALS